MRACSPEPRIGLQCAVEAPRTAHLLELAATGAEASAAQIVLKDLLEQSQCRLVVSSMATLSSPSMRISPERRTMAKRK